MHPQDTTPQKTCTKCGETKPATTEYFHRHKKGKFGLCALCKECAIAQTRIWSNANRERAREKSRLYYHATKNDENKIEQRREYRITNQEVIKDRQRTWYEANKEAILEKRNTYREANRELLAQKSRTYYWENRQQSLKRASVYRSARRQYLAACSRAYYQANKDQVAEWGRNYRITNHQKRIEYGRAYYLTHKDKFAEKRQQWFAAHPAAHKAAKQRRRARVANAEGTHTRHDIEAQYKAQKGKCYYCKAKVGDTYHVDHVIPLSRGGSNGPENLVIACPKCNQSKHDKLPSEWVEGGRLL